MIDEQQEKIEGWGRPGIGISQSIHAESALDLSTPSLWRLHYGLTLTLTNPN